MFDLSMKKKESPINVKPSICFFFPEKVDEEDDLSLMFYLKSYNCNDANIIYHVHYMINIIDIDR